jgi:hypothetical protein
MLAILTISRNTFTESIRQPIFLVMIGLVAAGLLLGLATSSYTFADDTVQMIIMGLFMMLLAGGVLAALVASGVISREVENRTVLTVISKPISRPAFVLGKYLGVMAAVTLAMWIWVLIYLLTVRHKVIAAAGDELDWPVIVFGFSAVGIALVVATFGNYFYNWAFNAAFIRVLAVTITLAYLMVLLINKQWQFQPITTEFDPDLAPLTNYGEERKSLVDVVLALGLVYLGVCVLTAVAVAVSTRLGQVMTLLVTLGVWALGVLNDALFGRNADTSVVADALYHILPNFQFFFLADALTLQHSVTAGYVGQLVAYAAALVSAALALGVALFQTRETG